MQTPPWYVLTGGPCSGKTTLIHEMKERGYTVTPESARTVIAAEVAAGRTIQNLLADPIGFEHLIISHQVELTAQADKDKEVFFDRGIPDNLAYYRNFGLAADPVLEHAIQSVQYKKIFLLDMIEFKGDEERYETSPEEANRLHEWIRQGYEELGYEIVQVPVVPVSERADYVLARLD